MKKKILTILIGILLISLAYPTFNKIAVEFGNLEPKGKIGRNEFTVVSRIIGAKKSATCVLWIKQTLNIGSKDINGKASSKNIYKISNEMFFLNPYFLGNYYFAGTTLGMIKYYKKLDIAMEILKRGLEYNPNDIYLKEYIAGVFAYSKGNDDILLQNFIDIVQEYKSPILINVIADTYENKYTKTKDKKYLINAIYYWYQNAKINNNQYKKIALDKIKKYTNQIKNKIKLLPN